MFDKKNLETRSVLDELRNFEKNVFFDLGHPLLNRIADCFVRAAGIGAVQALSKEAYFTAVEGCNGDTVASPKKARQVAALRGETNQKSVEALMKRTGKETLQWGMVAGVYSGLTYGLKEARGSHDWKNSALAGALTGGALALTLDHSSHEKVVQCVITGAALSTAANLLAGVL
ncbi:hypothetical protein SASPL_109476 [Salvia splendens]|uniref:Mitochondrial import inner membrane translocase subunit TIM22 n=1 Tax=Salvia splendens TaxID=180675 RepID=A0A8X9A752_SALSN|nr:outer envelope pore protein 16-2, chloroplastic-like [Salvia splendens]KAG6431397.1 hypothetical protein SASPL_109476 [Salvia splendens]